MEEMHNHDRRPVSLTSISLSKMNKRKIQHSEREKCEWKMITWRLMFICFCFFVSLSLSTLLCPTIQRKEEKKINFRFFRVILFNLNDAMVNIKTMINSRVLRATTLNIKQRSRKKKLFWSLVLFHCVIGLCLSAWISSTYIHNREERPKHNSQLRERGIEEKKLNGKNRIT